ncbi:MAG: hypothetical protein ACREP7_16240 [Lysobacter sp.]
MQQLDPRDLHIIVGGASTLKGAQQTPVTFGPSVPFWMPQPIESWNPWPWD